MLVVGQCVALPESTTLYPLLGLGHYNVDPIFALCNVRSEKKSLNSLYLQQDLVMAVVRLELQDS